MLLFWYKRPFFLHFAISRWMIYQLLTRRREASKEKKQLSCVAPCFFILSAATCLTKQRYAFGSYSKCTWTEMLWSFKLLPVTRPLGSITSKLFQPLECTAWLINQSHCQWVIAPSYHAQSQVWSYFTPTLRLSVFWMDTIIISSEWDRSHTVCTQKNIENTSPNWACREFYSRNL